MTHRREAETERNTKKKQGQDRGHEKDKLRTKERYRAVATQ